MSGVLSITQDQEFVYRVDVLQVFEGETYNRWYSYGNSKIAGERKRLDEPKVISVGFYNTARAARNYGSYRTNRSKWYNTLGAPEYWDCDQRKYVKPSQGTEPSLDYRVYKIPIKLDMGQAKEIPQLKRLYDLD